MNGFGCDNERNDHRNAEVLPSPSAPALVHPGPEAKTHGCDLTSPWHASRLRYDKHVIIGTGSDLEFLSHTETVPALAQPVPPPSRKEWWHLHNCPR